MRNIQYWLKSENLKPVAFYPYTSCVINRIAEQEFGYKTEEHDFVESLCNDVRAMLPDTISWDNKVVIECIHNITDRNVKTSNIFIGKYDGNWSIGFGVRSDSWINPWINPIKIE